MALKREISASLANLHNSVKRLHLDGTPKERNSQISTEETQEEHKIESMSVPPSNPAEVAAANQLRIDPAAVHHPLTTVVSRAGADFGTKYEIQHEIGRGGFSVVYHCKSLSSGKSYAVKIIDLRPLRLRDSFDAMRLRREVDIMRQLRHPNIIQFEEVFESPDQLFVVMEFAPGYELFDAILSRGHFSEEDAKPIFAQISRALLYLHSRNIIHRDIKPENILVLKDPDPHTGQPIAKLLDFGLSKHTGLGSEAKTFVGTPCYLAPEVEFASKGTGATYGAPADCWSLGAVLYVMLVARFPVFEVDSSSRPPTTRLALPSELFRNASPDAKDLLRALMCFNVNNRLSAQQALMHPWLGARYQLTSEELARFGSTGSVASFESDMSSPHRFIPVPPRLHTPIAEDALVTSMELVRRVDAVGSGKSPSGGLRQLVKGVDQLGLTPLLLMQSDIAACFDDALAAYQYMPEIATEIRRGADLCRRQLQESTKMLRKIEQTACSVLEMFPDLELAIAEGEPNLANSFFGMMKGWVSELMVLVETTQVANRASMDQIQKIVERSTHQLHVNMLQRDVTASLNSLAISKKGVGGDVLSGASINADFLIKMKKLLGTVLRKEENPASEDVDPATSEGNMDTDDAYNAIEGAESGSANKSSSENSMEHQLLQMFDIMLGRVLDGAEVTNDRAIEYPTKSREVEKPAQPPQTPEMEKDREVNRPATKSVSSVYVEDDNMEDSFDNNEFSDARSASAFSSETEDSARVEARKELQNALTMLRQVDVLLEQLSVFWANTEIVLDMLTKKGLHAEQFIQFSHKPKLYARFMERVVDYRNFWEGIKAMSQQYLVGKGSAFCVDSNKKIDRFSTPPDDMFNNQGSSGALHQKIIDSPF